VTHRLLSLLCTVLLAISGPASGAVIENLYEAAVPVADQSLAGREAGMRAALGVVLVRVTGQRAAPQQDRLAEMLGRAPAFVQQFRFEERPVPDPETGEPLMTLHLSVRFDPLAVQRALVARGIPVWGRERPSTLVWIAFDDGFERGILDDTANPVFNAAVDETARLRGLPVVWPLMDLQDRSALAFTDVWGGFGGQIEEASTRYRPNAVLIGRLFKVDAARWGARWSLMDAGVTRSMETPPGMLSSVLADGVHWVADAFGARGALLPDAISDGHTRVVVSGVESMADYATATRYLETLSPVSAVTLLQVDRDRLVYAVELRGSEQQLRQAIALGSRLREVEDSGDLGLLTLHYQLLR